MRKLLPAILICIGFSAASQALKEIRNFGKNPGNLSLFSFNAEERAGTRGKPLVVALHGCAMTAKKLALLSDWNKLASENGFVVFYPQQKLLNNGSNCFNWFLEKDINRNGESQSICEMIRYAIDTLQIDSSRIFLYGLSAGACMSDVLCANYPWLINAAAIYAGIPFRTATGASAIRLAGKTVAKSATERAANVKNQNPFYQGSYPRIIILHGTKDLVTDYGYAAEFIKQWTAVHGTDSTPSKRDTLYEGNPRVHRYAYYKEEKEKVVFYKFPGLGHKIAIDTSSGAVAGGKDKFLSEHIGFFSSYYIARDFGILKK